MMVARKRGRKGPPACVVWALFASCFTINFMGVEPRLVADDINPAIGRHLLQEPSKRGLASWTATVATEIAALNKISWWYNWALSQPQDAAAAANAHGVEFVPMLERPSSIGNLYSIQPSSKTLLTFKSPNFMNGSAVKPEDAARLWGVLRGGVASSIRIALPSAQPCPGEDNSAFCNVRSPFSWFDAFFRECNRLGLSCDFDIIATAFYTCNADYLAAYLDQLYRQYGKPIWVVEIACPLGATGLTGSAAVAEQIRFARRAFRVLDQSAGVERYAWFGIQTGNWAALGPSASLINSGSLTELGRLYAGLQQNSIAADATIGAALTEGLPEAYEVGPRAYSELCDNCTYGFGEQLNALQSNKAAFSSYVWHCRDCGYRDDWSQSPLL